MNCHMLNGMTTYVNEGSAGALFVHQMIPHHQNAVNMAKALLKSGELICGDVTDDENPDCVLSAIIRDIINTQNFQIQAMRGYLEGKEFRATDDCNVRLEIGLSPAPSPSAAMHRPVVAAFFLSVGIALLAGIGVLG